MMVGWDLQYTYRQLPVVMYQNATPAKLAQPNLVTFNHMLARELGLNPEAIDNNEWAKVLSGSSLPDISCLKSASEREAGHLTLAMAYAGHQFGHFNVLGDGRAILLGEQRTPSGKTFDIHLKGAGTTPYSRRGDGKAALGPMLREYLISEAMAALGIPTTRSLAVVATGELVERETDLPGAVLARVASSHIRVGTFQFAALQGKDCVKQLADYTISRHFHQVSKMDQPYLELLNSVIDLQARLMSSWLGVGFIHGVMNTDNMSICGETIDYGPCAFMDNYNPNQVYSYIDRQSRYAYQNQPAIALWNLERFAESLLTILDEHPDKAVAKAQSALVQFPEKFQVYWFQLLAQKLGLNDNLKKHQELIASFLNLLEKLSPDFTTTFRGLCEETLPSNSFFLSDDFLRWHQIYLIERKTEGVPDDLIRQKMKTFNPRIIPRNHLVQRALDAAENHGDLSLFEKLLNAVSSPFEDNISQEKFWQPPLPHEEIGNTFCGT